MYIIAYKNYSLYYYSLYYNNQNNINYKLSQLPHSNRYEGEVYIFYDKEVLTIVSDG